jgi:hypothetical protein
MYPAMLYRDGVLSGDPANQRTVADESAELEAMGQGFTRWETKAMAEAGAATTESVAADVAFANASRPEGAQEPAAQIVKRKARAR